MDEAIIVGGEGLHKGGIAGASGNLIKSYQPRIPSDKIDTQLCKKDR